MLTLVLSKYLKRACLCPPAKACYSAGYAVTFLFCGTGFIYPSIFMLLNICYFLILEIMLIVAGVVYCAKMAEMYEQMPGGKNSMAEGGSWLAMPVLRICLTAYLTANIIAIFACFLLHKSRLLGFKAKHLIVIALMLFFAYRTLVAMIGMHKAGLKNPSCEKK